MLGTPVPLLIDPARPDTWSVLYSIEELAARHDKSGEDLARLGTVIDNALAAAARALAAGRPDEAWRPHSSRVWSSTAASRPCSG